MTDISKKELKKKRTTEVLKAALSNAPARVGTAFDLAEAYYGAGLKLRHERATEWVEMIRDNPEKFTKEITETEEFQDKFVYCLEKYIRERAEEKRKIFRKIFLGKIELNRKDVFPIEKYIDTLQIMSKNEISALRNLYFEHKGKDLGEFFDINIGVNGKGQIIHSLINLDFLIPNYRSGSGVTMGSYSMDLEVKISVFGLKFIEYITDEN